MPNAKPIPFQNVTNSQKARFWKKVHSYQSGDSCWPWIGATKTKRGVPWYGHMTMNKSNIGASRIGWMIIHGQDPFPKHVLHTCDNRLCCNPRHWYLGTNKDNCQDKAKRFRNGRKLNPAQVAAIKSDLNSGAETRISIAAKYGLGITTVAYIHRGLIWKYVLPG